MTNWGDGPDAAAQWLSACARMARAHARSVLAISVAFGKGQQSRSWGRLLLSKPTPTCSSSTRRPKGAYITSFQEFFSRACKIKNQRTSRAAGKPTAALPALVGTEASEASDVVRPVSDALAGFERVGCKSARPGRRVPGRADCLLSVNRTARLLRRG